MSTKSHVHARPSLDVSSSGFRSDGPIPERYTCDGEDLSPPLAWTAGPAGTQSYALIVDDPDAASGLFTHWIAWNLTATELSEAAHPSGDAARPWSEGRNSFGRHGWGGPCPPSGTHRYVFHVHALDTRLELPDTAEVQQLRATMEGHELARGVLVGTYRRH
jgi:Raf kinase inhibitor-like YbhB/YbcL family protein